MKKLCDPIQLTERFVRVPSESGVPGAENAMADEIAAALREIGLEPGFWPAPGDRKSVWALWRGAPDGDDAYILLSHFDTVPVSEHLVKTFGREGAFDPTRVAEAAGDEDARSGEYLFGRGALDMKSGIAAQIAGLAERPGANVLFVSCPDEENESAGILSALEPIAEAARGLRVRAVINSDYTAPRYSGDTARYLYLGAVGKLLVATYAAGLETHVGEPYRGLDAAALAAEIVRETALNPDLCDRAGGETTVPPVPLLLRDLKEEYNVQTAGGAFACFNVMTHSLSPRAALEKVREAARRAVGTMLQRRLESFERYAAGSGQAAPGPLSVPVLLYEEVRSGPVQAGGGDARTAALEIVRRVANLAPPFVIVFLAPPYYPHVHETDPAFRAWAGRIAARFEMTVRDFYPYISDVSYIGGAADASHMGEVAANLPQWGAGYDLPGAALLGPGYPILNLGPWGREAHGVFERVEKRSILAARDAILAAITEPW